jgi:hypothetical protein
MEQFMKQWIIEFNAARCVRNPLMVGVVIMFSACKSVPDAGPFSAAGSQLHSAVVTAGNVVSSALVEAQLPDFAKRLNEQWQIPDACTLAMMRYGDALASIVQTSRDSSAAAQQVIKAGTDLATSVGAAVPPLLAAPELSALAGTVVQQVENAHAARSLEEALSGMQPAVDDVAKLLTAQLNSVDSILTDANLKFLLNLTTEYNQELRYRLTLTAERRALYDSPRTADTTRQLDDIIHREQVIAPTLAAFDQKDAENQHRLKARRELITTAKQAIANWAEAHRNLLIAVRNGGTVDVMALNESIVELRALINKARMS